MTIEEKIRAKKEEIKRVNRELSRLQDEARAKDEPMKIKVSRVYVNRISYDYVVDIERTEKRQSDDYKINIVANCNKWPKAEDIIKAIESISESSEPKSYVDWGKIDDRFNYVTVHGDGVVGAWSARPKFYDMANNWYADGAKTDWCVVPHTAIVGTIPECNKSLIHRPGIKE